MEMISHVYQALTCSVGGYNFLAITRSLCGRKTEVRKPVFLCPFLNIKTENECVLAIVNS